MCTHHKENQMSWQANENRYGEMSYRRCGNSGLLLPGIAMGLWHNFGDGDCIDNMRAMLQCAFDLGVTHFDLANNYGPPPGSAEKNFGEILKKDFASHRDELIISSKAGYLMWPGPYGDKGSRKYLISSCDQSLKRMGLDYVDIFYSHRPDAETPLEETMGALDYIVRSGRALYVGLSNYSPEQTRQAVKILKELGTPCLIHQPSYSMFNRTIEEGLLDVLEETGTGCIVFCPLSQGMLTDKYLGGIAKDSRAGKPNTFLKSDAITDDYLRKAKALNRLAEARCQSLAQMALAWALRDSRVTTALIGASKASQVQDSVQALKNATFTKEELQKINDVLGA